MDRRDFLAHATAAAAAIAVPAARAESASSTAGLEELSLTDIASAFSEGSLTSVQLTQMYLTRIDRLDRSGPRLRAVIETNPQALSIAAQLDAERQSRGSRGELHGVPILIKDNVETSDRMMTTAGSLALEGWYAPKDASLVARLRSAGAVILGKSNLSEWANFRSTHSVSGWSGRGGQTRNPYAVDRSPSGSSSGSAVAVAANLCALAVGTETDGSIVSPASINGVVGLKPTVGLVSCRGIAPISHSQDSAGPLARNVRDAAVMLGVMAGLDQYDAASLAVGNRFDNNLVRYIDAGGLRGARLGIARRFFADNEPLDTFLTRQVALLRDGGAVIVDPADLPTHGATAVPEQEVLLYEFKADLSAYLRRLPPTFPVRSLSALIRFNQAHQDREMPFFGQELLHQAEAKGALTDKAYLDARAACLTASRSNGIDAVLAQYKLDAMVALTAGPAWLIDSLVGDSDTGGCSSPAAVAGYPHITVPAGLFRGLPIGLSFFGTAFSEPMLIKLASGFESITRARAQPQFLPSAATV